MREKLHQIINLALDLNEQCATNTSFLLFPHAESFTVHVWEGEPVIGNYLIDEHAYYAGSLCDEAKVNDIIRELEELRDNI